MSIQSRKQETHVSLHQRKITMKKSLIILLPLTVACAAAFVPGGQQLSRRDSHYTRTLAAVISNQVVDNTSSSTLLEPTEQNNNDNNERQQQPPDEVVIMSQALPFLPCPPVLRDNNFAGNVGFDPFGLAQSTEQLWYYREAEIKHARLAMLAAAGWPISELLDRQLATWFHFEPLLDAHDRAPSLFDNLKGLERVSPTFWGFLFGLTAVIELEYGSHSLFFSSKQQPQQLQQDDPDYFPGKLGLDPLGFYPQSDKGRHRMQLAEIKHGRLAMIAVVIYCLTEYITKEGIIDEVVKLFSTMPPIFPFFPMISPTAETMVETELVERLAGME